MKRYYALSVLLLTSMMVMAQDLKITKIELNTKIQTALVNQEVDPVGQRKCAVLHVVTKGLTPEERNYMLQFQLDNAHSIVKTVKDGGEIQLYVPEGTVRLTVKSELGNYRCDFREHGLKDGVESLKDYYVYIVYNRPASGPKEEDLGGQYFVLTVSPATANVYVDNKPQAITDGELTIMLPYGEHSYRVEAPSFVSDEGRFTIGRDKVTKTVNLVSSSNTVCTISMEAKRRFLSFTVDGVAFKMLSVKGGTFTMGATSEQGGDAYDSEKPTHRVTLSSYYMGETEVTQDLWQAVMGYNPSKFKGGNLPVERVTLYECQEFVEKLNQLFSNQLNGKQFCLPTEAEWEYAARGGKKSRGYKYSGSNTLDDVAWYDDDFIIGSTHAVGTKQANELGLYDMSGNVMEWCSDWWGDYGSSVQTDPTGPVSGSYSLNRGGCWFYNARKCRVSHRSCRIPSSADFDLGLRLSLR